jgi:uncharacterized protein
LRSRATTPSRRPLSRGRRQLAPHAEIRTYPGGHFDIYVGDTFEQAVTDQVEFLTRHLTPRYGPA